MTQFGVLAGISVLMTIGVYGLVAGIVKIDDLGLWLQRTSSEVGRTLGRVLIAAAPRLMKLLSIAGTAAMFLVGGGILVHNVPAVHHALEAAAAMTGPVAGAASALLAALIGACVGALVLLVVEGAKRLRR